MVAVCEDSKVITDRIEVPKALFTGAGRVDPPRAWESTSFSFSTWNVLSSWASSSSFADRNNHNNIHI